VPEVADIFRLHGEAYRERFGKNMLPSHRRALSDIRDCRTAAMGGQLYVCDQCGQEHYVYHSCRNRSCPKCHGKQTRQWLEARRKELLPVPYFHVVFTVPSELHGLVRANQIALYSRLMKAAAESLIKLAGDPKYVGAQIGVMAVLHTWTRNLNYHPHVHCLVPGGGLSAEGQWRPAGEGYLVPVRALSRIFRGKFLDELARILPNAAIPVAARNQDWVVYCKPTVQGAENVLNYLGRYVHRIAITDRRILHVDEEHVTFSYQDAKDRKKRTMTVTGQEFLRRFLQHVLPKGVHKVRYYGLWAPPNRKRLEQARQILTRSKPDGPRCGEPSDSPAAMTPPERPAFRCPYCQRGTLVFRQRLPRQPRSPP
jgi:hypothetical protein